MTDTRTPVGLAEALEAIAVDVMVANRIRRNCAVAATKLREMAAALEPFARVYEINEKISEGWADDKSARDAMPRAWPTWGDLRTARRALRGEP